MFISIFIHRKRMKSTWAYIFRSVLSKDYNTFSGRIFFLTNQTLFWKCVNEISYSIPLIWRPVVFTLLRGQIKCPFICFTIFKHVHSEQVHWNLKNDTEYKSNFNYCNCICAFQWMGPCLLLFSKIHLVMHKVTHEWVFRNLTGNENYISYWNNNFTLLSFSYAF